MSSQSTKEGQYDRIFQIRPPANSLHPFDVASLAGLHSGQAWPCEKKKAPEEKNPKVKHPAHGEESGEAGP